MSLKFINLNSPHVVAVNCNNRKFMGKENGTERGTIQAMMIVKTFLGYFSVSFPESSMFAFIVIEPISKLSYGFCNIRSLITPFTFQKVQYFFPSYKLIKVVVVLIELQTKQVFFPHGSHLPVSLVLGRAPLTRQSLSGADNKWSSYNMFLIF